MLYRLIIQYTRCLRIHFVSIICYRKGLWTVYNAFMQSTKALLQVNWVILIFVILADYLRELFTKLSGTLTLTSSSVCSLITQICCPVNVGLTNIVLPPMCPQFVVRNRYCTLLLVYTTVRYYEVISYLLVSFLFCQKSNIGFYFLLSCVTYLFCALDLLLCSTCQI